MSGDKATNQNSERTTGASRTRSSIDFPYFDQDDAIKVAEAVHAVGGTSCDWDQLAAQMKQAASGGGFRIRVMAGRTFGLLVYDRGSVTLTELGIRAIDPKFARAARAESFLAVPLFKTMYEKLRGGMLPPIAAIERGMETAGVPPKTKEKARQVFMRAAKQAGFFEIDQNRLTFPPNTGATMPPPVVESESKHTSNGGGTGGGGDDLHPFIRGLLDKLPEPETEWPMQARAKWLETASNIFDLMYKAGPDDGTKMIEVDVTVNASKL